MKNGMGHLFGADLVCECEVTWAMHLADPKPCALLQGTPQVRTISDDSLAQLRVAMGIPLSKIAVGLGVSVHSVQRAVNGQVGGKGCTRPEVREQVMDFLGVKAGE